MAYDKKFNKSNNQNFKKKEIRTYTKCFQSFVDGINELTWISYVALEILNPDKVSELTSETPDSASMKMFNAIADNFPILDDRNTSAWSINLSSTRCTLKAGWEASFGWKLKYEYNRETRTKDIYDIEFFITDFNESRDIQDATSSYGWQLKENYK